MHERLFFLLLIGLVTVGPEAGAQEVEIQSPDRQLKLTVSVNNGQPVYAVSYQGKQLLENSPLGLVTNEADLSTGITIKWRLLF